MSRAIQIVEAIQGGVKKVALSPRAGRYLSLQRQEDIETNFPDGTNLEIITYVSRRGKLAAMAFRGKQSKPAWNYSFKNEKDREKTIDGAIKSSKASIEYKEKVKQERRDYKHDLAVGDILYSSWGYDQTNIDFYQVTKLIGKMIEMRPIGSKIKSSTGYQDYVVPTKGKFTGKKMRKKVGKYGVSLNSYSSASKWDGTPMAQTGMGYGH